MAVFNFRVDTFDKALNFGVRYFWTNPKDDKGKPPQMMLSKGNDLKNCLIWGWWILSILPVPATYFFSAAMSLNRLGWVSKVVKAAWPPMASESSEFGDGFPKNNGDYVGKLASSNIWGARPGCCKISVYDLIGKRAMAQSMAPRRPGWVLPGSTEGTTQAASGNRWLYIYDGQPKVPVEAALEVLRLAEAYDLPKLAGEIEASVPAWTVPAWTVVSPCKFYKKHKAFILWEMPAKIGCWRVWDLQPA